MGAFDVWASARQAMEHALASEHAADGAADRLARAAYRLADLLPDAYAPPIRILRRIVGCAGIELSDVVAVGAAAFVCAAATPGFRPILVRLRRTQPAEQLTMAAARALALFTFWNSSGAVLEKVGWGGVEAGALAIAMPAPDLRDALRRAGHAGAAARFSVPVSALDARLRMLGETVGSGERPVSAFRLTTARAVVDSKA